MSTILIKRQFRADCAILEEYFSHIRPIIGHGAFEKARLIQLLLTRSSDNIVNYYVTMKRINNAAEMLKLIVKATNQLSDRSAEVLFILTQVSANSLLIVSEIEAIVEKRGELDHERQLIFLSRDAIHKPSGTRLMEGYRMGSES